MFYDDYTRIYGTTSCSTDEINKDRNRSIQFFSSNVVEMLTVYCVSAINVFFFF